MEEQKASENNGREEKLPLDARLLSEAVIEFNISRRSVGLYPPGHAIIINAIRKAFELLQKLFEIRSTITLGIAKDSLIIDEYALDRKNPVYREVALSFHSKGIAGITFQAGLVEEELTKLHELLTGEDAPDGKALAELAAQEGLLHVKLSPIDYSSFRFVEGATGSTEATGEAVWEDYVYGLLQGKLLDDDSAAAVRKIPAEKMAEAMNSALEDEADGEAYDRVITTYLRDRRDARLSRESLDKLIALTGSLSPKVKQQFLSRTFRHPSMDISEVENTLREMTTENFGKMAEFFTRHSSMIPETLKNVIDKLSSIKSDKSFSFDMLLERGPVIHDIEIGNDLARLFDEDRFRDFVRDDYKKELGIMLDKTRSVLTARLEELREECRDEVIDRVSSEVMIETLETDIITAEDYLSILTRLSEMSTEFVNTGRFEEVLNIYTTVYSHSLSGKFRHEAESALRYFFRSEDFLMEIVEAARAWGRHNRDGVVRFTRALKSHLVCPFMDALAEEQDTSLRKLMLSILSSFGSDVVPEAVRRLGDSRWYVTRNMLYLVRACGTLRDMGAVRKYVRHRHPRVVSEALRALLHFKTPDAIPFLKVLLQSKDPELQRVAVTLSGMFRVKEAVPLLIKILDRKDPFGTGSAEKITVVRALGDIGERSAIEPLLKILNSNVYFWKGYHEELKVEIFRSLKNYPSDVLAPFFDLGIQAENAEIRAICEMLSKKPHDDSGGN